VGLVDPGAIDVLRRAIERSATYDADPRGLPAAREAVARRAAELGNPLDPADVVLVASTSEAYAHLIRLLAEPDDAILVPRPSYPLVEPIAAAEGVRVHAYDLVADDAWRPDLASLERALAPRVRAIVVVQPNNPTGTCLDAPTIAALDAFAAERGIALISDEVFGEFPWDRGSRRLPSLLGEREALTFVLDGISKSCGLPQMKLAWIALAGPRGARLEAMHGLEWLADLFLSPSGPAQMALPGWLERRGVFQEMAGRRLGENLARLRGLVARAPSVELCAAAGGWSAVLRLPSTRTDESWAFGLIDQGVAVHPGHFYDFPRGTYLVTSLLPARDAMDRGIEALENVLASPA
jgi:aspartate/methionine/tyrosine aminotransferase